MRGIQTRQAETVLYNTQNIRLTYNLIKAEEKIELNDQ